MADETYWIDKAQSAEAKLATLAQQIAPLKEKLRSLREALGARDRADGAIEIDYEKLVRNLGLMGALDLRAVIDEIYRVSGALGEKPRVKVPAAASRIEESAAASRIEESAA